MQTLHPILIPKARILKTVWRTAVLLASVGTARASAAAALTCSFSPAGLARLTYNGVNLLSDGALQIQSVKMTDASGHSTDGSVSPLTTTFTPTADRIRETFTWGVVTCKYAVAGSHMALTIAVTNNSSSTLQQITLQALSVKFPSAPKTWVPDYVYIASNTGDPSIVTADYGSGELAVCNDDILGGPLLVGFPGRHDLVGPRPIVISTTKGWVLSPYLDPYINRPIAPGKTDIYHISLRFGPSGSTEKTLAPDLLARFARAYPSTLHWPDHRAIAEIHLAASETNLHSKTNPRGWFSDPMGVDITTPSGRAAFKTRVLKFADDSITEMKTDKAQGMIVWDIEGEELPQATTYIGDPRLISRLDPEMDTLADAFFKKFREAGFAVGECLRPQILMPVPGGTYEQKELDSNQAIIDNLVAKIRYANTRFGCTLFYVDSNGDPNVPYDPAIFQGVMDKVTALGIKCLIMPEHKNARYYACTAPYCELRLGHTDVPSLVREIYPKAFTCISIPDGPVEDNRKALIDGMKAGNILLFRGWWPDPYNAKVRDLYQSASK